MKKLISILVILFSVPLIGYASIATPWNATSTNIGYISPNRVNGNDPFIKASYVVATSTTATSTLPNLSAVNMAITSLTSGRIPFAGTGGFLNDTSSLTWNSVTKAMTINVSNALGSILNVFSSSSNDPAVGINTSVTTNLNQPTGSYAAGIVTQVNQTVPSTNVDMHGIYINGNTSIGGMSQGSNDGVLIGNQAGQAAIYNAALEIVDQGNGANDWAIRSEGGKWRLGTSGTSYGMDINSANLTQGRVATFPDEDGTIAMQSDIPWAISGSDINNTNSGNVIISPGNLNLPISNINVSSGSVNSTGDPSGGNGIGTMTASRFLVNPNEITGMAGGFGYDDSCCGIVEMGLNVDQFGTVGGYDGGFFRFDTRDNSPFFQVGFQPKYGNIFNQVSPLTISSQNADGMLPVTTLVGADFGQGPVPFRLGDDLEVNGNGLVSNSLQVGTTTSMVANTSLYAVASSTKSTVANFASTTGATEFIINPLGNVGISTSTPYANFSVQSNTSTGDAFVIATSSGKMIRGEDNSGHAFTGGPTPVLSSCGTGSPTVTGDDQTGTITTGTAATSCTMTFAKVYANTPVCNFNDDSATIPGDISSISTSAVTFALGAGLSGGHLYYQCAYHK